MVRRLEPAQKRVRTVCVEEREYSRAYGPWLASRREARKLTRRELGRLVGVSESMVRRWEEATAIPNLYHGHKLREALIKPKGVLTRDRLMCEARKRAQENGVAAR